MSKAKVEYLWCRRRTKKTLGLLSASVPLDAQSFVIFDHTSKSCGVISNTNTAHLTLVDGYMVSWGNNEYSNWLQFTLRMALHNNPSVITNSLHTVPRLSNAQTLLVVADVSASFNKNAAKRLVQKCALPQFPLHLAVGTCSSDADDTLALAPKQLVGLKLNVDVTFLSILAPSLDQTIRPDIIHRGVSDVSVSRQAAQNITQLPYHDEALQIK